MQEYAQTYLQLAAYEMGEHHVAHSRPRVIGELSLAEVYLSHVITLDNEVSASAGLPAARRRFAKTLPNNRMQTLLGDFNVKLGSCNLPKDPRLNRKASRRNSPGHT